MKLVKATRKGGGADISFGDFNVFIGGNGVGKTTIISEIYHKAADAPRTKYWWIENLSYSSDNIRVDMSRLQSTLAWKKEGTSLFYFSNAVKNADGELDLGNDSRFSESDFKGMPTINDDTIYNDKKYRRAFIAFSSCDSRLNLANESPLDRLDQPAQNPINLLERNKILLRDIDKNIFDIYKSHFTLLSHVGTALQIGLSKSVPPTFDHNADSKQAEFQKIETWKDEHFIPIREAGHGIRSMARLLTSLLEPVNQVILIDEPEMHLYPSQKRWLGKQLVNLAKTQKKQVFLVTHDPMVLQGILDANTTTNIFRVDRNDAGEGTISVSELSRVEATHSRNQDQYLQGLFYQRCIVVEGASDRAFYQEMFDGYPQTQDKDLGVVVAGGVGGSAHVAAIVSKVHQKTAFIYDLDVLLDNRPLMKGIYSTLGGEGNPVEKLEAIFDAATASVAADDKISECKKLTGYDRITGFETAWVSANQVAVDEALSKLASVGMFIVPNGALESWAPAVKEKVRFAERAPQLLRADSELKAHFDAFGKKVLGYLGITLS